MFESGLRTNSLINNDFSANQVVRILPRLTLCVKNTNLLSSTKATVFVNGFGMLSHSGE